MKKKIAVFFICTAAVLAIGATILIVIKREHLKITSAFLMIFIFTDIKVMIVKFIKIPRQIRRTRETKPFAAVGYINIHTMPKINT